MTLYLDESNLKTVMEAHEQIRIIRNNTFIKTGVDVLENDTVSLLSFAPYLRKIDPNYNPNFARNGDDGNTIKGNAVKGVESKTTKVNPLKKGGYSKATFAFHAKGLINHEIYSFNTWDKNTLTPQSLYYAQNPKNVKVINKELENMSEEWSKKPATKAGYDVIRIKEDMLKEMVETTEDINGCKVHTL